MGKAPESRLGPQKKISNLWATVKALNPKKPTTPTNTTITHNNKTAHTDTQKANTLNEYFKSTTEYFSNPTHRITNTHQITHIYPNNNHQIRYYPRYKTI